MLVGGGGGVVSNKKSMVAGYQVCEEGVYVNRTRVAVDATIPEAHDDADSKTD